MSRSLLGREGETTQRRGNKLGFPPTLPGVTEGRAMGRFRAREGAGSDLGREGGHCWPQSQTQQDLFILDYLYPGRQTSLESGPPADKTHKDKRLGAGFLPHERNSKTQHIP